MGKISGVGQVERDLGGAGNWGQVIQLLAGDGEEFDNYGVGVDIDGDTIVVGASQTLDNFGTADVYERDLRLIDKLFWQR